MDFTPTIFMAQLLLAMQVLMTLNMMPLRTTTMALPVTSKPIESTVENLAWQAWIELPPEQKQQVKSRKVTPKSIFTLPLRVECPEGHKQVDTKCIPIAIGSNAVLVDLNALGLVVGNTPTDELYDYDDMGDEEEVGNMQPQFDGGYGMQMGEAEKSIEGLTVELKPPTKDEPLKFNIFENKFHIFHEEPLEDYSALSNEGSASGGEQKDEIAASTTEQQQPPLNATTAAINSNNLVSEASNIAENDITVAEPLEQNSSSITLATMENEGESGFKIDAISLPVGGFESQKPQKLAIFQKDSALQLITSVLDSEATTSSVNKPQENDIQTLLQTESFLPLLRQATATTLQNSGPIKSSSATISLPTEQADSSPDASNLNVDEELTTMVTSLIEPVPSQLKNKQEFTRSVTINPFIEDEGVITDDNDRVNETTTLETKMIDDDERMETTTPIQLDDTTIIETSSSLSTTPASQQQQQQQNLKELLLKQEQAIKNFEELLRMRKGQRDQHVVLKKSKVEPVKVLATTVTTTTTTTNSLPTAAAAAEIPTEIVTPLLAVHNENNDNNNDRFYYQQIAKQDTQEEETQQPIAMTTTTSIEADSATATTAAEVEKMPLTSEIDLEEELRSINSLVKGKKSTTKTKTTTSTTTTTTTSTEKLKTTLNTEIATTTTTQSPDTLSESSLFALKTTPSSQQIWSKIMPLLATTTTNTNTTKKPRSSEIHRENDKDFDENLKEPNTADISNDIQTAQASKDISLNKVLASTARYNRNSKITRINDLRGIDFATSEIASTTDTTSTTRNSSIETSTENYSYEPYWWLPVAWRFDKPIAAESSEKPSVNEQVQNEEQPLLLRFWSAYHSPSKSS